MIRRLFASAALVLGIFAATGHGKETDGIVALGDDTYALTRTASTGWARDTGKLKARALEEAAQFCAKRNKEMKVLSTTTDKPSVPLMGIAYAKVVFKALDANDPELHEPVMATSPDGVTQVGTVAPHPKTKTDILYSDLTKLDELRKRGLLTEEEFQARRKKLLEESN